MRQKCLNKFKKKEKKQAAAAQKKRITLSITELLTIMITAVSIEWQTNI